MRKIKIRVKTAKGVRVKIRRVKPREPRCSVCKQKLKGTINAKTSKQANTAKTKKRPSRLYGGVLCARCSREKIKRDVRSKNV
ncbi:MAG: hypothetical protein PHE43_04410 [Candidatus Nanoarchaeia archaeon]|nr:hypothetical protein [Candidatus Nanoarchaeia archaeon]